jgi:hypothetical protein
LNGEAQFFFVLRRNFHGGIGKVRQKGVKNIPVGVGKVMDLQFFQLFGNVRFLFQQGGNDHEGPEVRGGARQKFQTREMAGRHHDRDEIVDPADGQVTGREQAQK